MQQFLKKKIFLVLITGFLIISSSVLASKAFFVKREIFKKTDSFEKNCQNVPELPDNALKLVTKVIDGDTLIIEDGFPIRILGIDTDEQDYPCYQEAKNKLEELVLNKEVKLQKEKKDKDRYCRYLRHIFLDGQNIGLELIKQGLAVSRFSSDNINLYKDEIIEAEKNARKNKIGCKWSAFANVSADKISDKKTEFFWEKLTPEFAGLKVVDACQARKFLGSEIIVEGKISGAHRSKSNTIFLNFGKSYPNQCFTAVIFSSKQNEFLDAPEKYYLRKTVRIRGKIEEYKNKPEIILNESSQIEIGKE